VDHAMTVTAKRTRRRMIPRGPFERALADTSVRETRVWGGSHSRRHSSDMTWGGHFKMSSKARLAGLSLVDVDCRCDECGPEVLRAMPRER
jgi:hypothetical protein